MKMNEFHLWRSFLLDILKRMFIGAIHFSACTKLILSLPENYYEHIQQ